MAAASARRTLFRMGLPWGGMPFRPGAQRTSSERALSKKTEDMMRTPEQTQSPWMSVHPAEALPLEGDASADVCVIGAGIAGMTTAYLAAKKGKSVIVIDSGP